MIPPDLARAVATKADVALRPASAEDLARLRALGVPPSVVSFYERFEPAACAEISDVRLWPIAEVVEENTDYVPGCDLHPRGFVVFATTVFGDAYCLDLNEPGPPVTLMSHEVLFSELGPDELGAVRKVVASSFDDFIRHFASGGLDLEPLS